MFENIMKFFKKLIKSEKVASGSSKDAAKERLHLVLMQDRANVSADFLELMKQEIIDVIKKYIDVDESAIDVRLTNKENEDGTNGAPALYANIPIVNIKNETRKVENKDKSEKENVQKDVAENKDEQIKNEEKQEETNTEKEDKEKDKNVKETEKEISENDEKNKEDENKEIEEKVNSEEKTEEKIKSEN